MDENRLRYLFQRFNARVANDAEVEELYNALFKPEDEHVLKSIVDEMWDSWSPVHTKRLDKGRADHIYQEITAEKKQGVPIKRIWPRIAITAAVLGTVFVLGSLYLNKVNPKWQPDVGYQNDIKPGKIGATLTLSNGKKIDLGTSANQELARESGVVVTKTANGRLVYQSVASKQPVTTQTNTLTTANGQNYQLRLPDGTRVWLNAESAITYPVSFTGLKQRIVQLKGEAYLEVSKDKTHPFILRTERQDIQVLGTHFNVYAYQGEPTKTALAEGAVRVTVGKRSKSIVPGQQTVVDDQNIKVEAADLEYVMAWKNGDFDFDDEPISNIMAILARWYDIQVKYQDDFSESRLTGSISRNRNISQVLRMLEQTKKVHFKVEGRRVIVMP